MNRMKLSFNRPSLKDNPLFFRILCSFLILLLPIVILGGIYYINFINKTKLEFSEKVTSGLESSVEIIDSYISTAQNTSLSFFTDESIQNLIAPYDQYTLEDRTELKKIQSSIARVQTLATNYADRIFAFVDDSKVYTSEGIEDFSLFFENTYRYENYDTAFWRSRLQSELRMEVGGPSNVDTTASATRGRIVPFMTTGYINGTKTVVVINISMDVIKRSLMKNLIFDSSEFFVLDSASNVLLSGSAYDVSDDVIGLAALYPGVDKSFREVSMKGADYAVAQVVSKKFGWNYYSVTPISELERRASFIMTYTVTICLLLMVVGIIFAFIFSFNIYSPIKKMRDILLSDQQFLHESIGNQRHSELQLINMSIEQLLKHRSQSKTMLDSLSYEFLMQSFNDLFLGLKLQNKTRLTELFQEQLHFDSNKFLCCNFLISYQEAFYKDFQDMERSIIMSKMKKVIWGLLDPHVKCYVANYKEDLYVCIINAEEEIDRAYLRNAIKQAVSTFKYDTRYCLIHVGIGKMHDDIEGIGKSYSEAMSALEARDPAGNLQIIDAADLAIVDRYYYSFVDENRMINSLKNTDYDLLKAAVTHIIAYNKEKGVSYPCLKLLIAEIYKTGQRYVTEKGLNLHTFISEQAHISLSRVDQHASDLAELTEMLMLFFERIIVYAESQQESRSGSLIESVKEYINLNYPSNLYLENIAEHFSISSKYLSKMFKDRMGVNLSDYISQVRLSKAKALLLTSEKSIQEISLEVGIISRTTFLRLFKKFEGVSPNDYRKKENL